jgi:putative phage-type endonuclease
MKAIKLVSTIGMSREKWLEFRKAGLGGSDASSVLGVSKYKSPLRCWLEKTGQAPDEDGISEAAFWGTTLEAVIAKVYADRNPDVKVRNVNFILQHPNYPWMLANIDRLLIYPDGTKAVLEVKTAGFFVAGEWAEDDVPVAYMAQAAHYMAVTGLDKVIFVCLIAGQKLVIREFIRDMELEESLIAKELEFWDMVQSDTMPAMDGSDDCADCLDFMYSGKVAETVELPDEAMPWIEMFNSAKEAEKEAKGRKDLASNNLKALLQANEIGLCGEYQLGWKYITTNKLDSDLLEEKYPGAKAECLAESSYAKFTLGKKKVPKEKKEKKTKEAA